MSTPRQLAEAEMGITSTPIVKKGAPSAWRKSIKYWFALGVGFVLGCITAGVLTVVLKIVE